MIEGVKLMESKLDAIIFELERISGALGSIDGNLEIIAAKFSSRG